MFLTETSVLIGYFFCTTFTNQKTKVESLYESRVWEYYVAIARRVKRNTLAFGKACLVILMRQT